MKLLLYTWELLRPYLILLTAGAAIVYLILNMMAFVMAVLTEVLNAA